MQDFNFDDYAASSVFNRVIEVIEHTGRQVVMQDETLVAVNGDGEVSFAALITEHNGELEVRIPRTKWFAKFSNWLAESIHFDAMTVYVEHSPGGTFRVYCA
jgi:hypothetical protein